MRIANYVDNALNLFILTFITNASIANIIIVVVFMWVDLFPSKNNTVNWMGKYILMEDIAKDCNGLTEMIFYSRY